MKRISIIVCCMQLLCLSSLVAQEGTVITPPEASIEKMMVADEYGFYVNNCTMEYFVELHNPFDVPLDLIEQFSTNGYRSPFFWRPKNKGVRIRPGKSLLVGIIDVRLRDLCDLDSFARTYPYYRFNVYCRFAANAESESVFHERGPELMMNSREGWSDFRWCGIDSSGLTRNQQSHLSTSAHAVDSLEISTDRFDYVIRGNPKRAAGTSGRLIFGLVKLHNSSSGYMLVDSVYTDDDATEIIGLPNWTRAAACTAVAIPPGGSALVEYESRVIDERFEGSTKGFLENGHSFTVFVRLRGSEGTPARARVRLELQGLRRQVAVPGISSTKDGYDAPENLWQH